MTTKRNEKKPPMEDGLARCLQAIDNQIAREMQRTPTQREERGVVKNLPMRTRVEQIASYLVSEIGSDTFSLEAIMVLANAANKALYVLVDELGEETLGKVRTSYAYQTFEEVKQDAERGLQTLGKDQDLML